MFQITCPHCGARDASEFTYGGDATVERPEGSEDPKAWMDYVYLRDNPRGAHWEYWHNVSGCRKWLKVERDTLSHEVTRVLSADQKTPARSEAGE